MGLIKAQRTKRKTPELNDQTFYFTQFTENRLTKTERVQKLLFFLPMHFSPDLLHLYSFILGFKTTFEVFCLSKFD